MKKHVLLAKILMIVAFTGFLTAFSSQSYAQCDLTFDISSASWGDCTNWTVTDNDGNVVLSGGPYGNGYADVQTLTGANNGPYNWNIVSFCGDNSPNYTVSSGADVLFTGNVPGGATANVGPINCPAPAACDITVNMSSASWGDGTTWTLTDNDGNTVLSGGPYGNGYADSQTLSGADNAPYTLNIVTTFGDNSPNYEVLVDGNLEWSGNIPGGQTGTISNITCDGNVPPPPAGCELTFTISSPSWGDGTTWTVTDNDGNTVLSGGPYGNGYSDTQTIPSAGNGPYTLNITSTFSDNSPNYNVSSGATVLFSGTAPASQTTNVGPINCPAPPSCEIAVTMSSASWGDATTWTLTDNDGNTVLSGGPYGNGYSDTQTLPVADNGPYTLTITSNLSDNIPNYSVSVDGSVILSGTAPASQTTVLNNISCNYVPPCQIDVDMSSASWGDGTTWTLTDNDGNTVLSGGPYGNGYSDSQSISSAQDGPYTLTINSTLSDNFPGYVVSVGGTVVFSGTAPASQTTTVGPIAPECSIPPTPCEAAMPIACGDVVTGSTVGAPTDAVPTCVTTNGTGGKIWYEFTGTGEVVTATTCNALTNYDTKLWVFSGDCDNLVCVTGNDDMGVACGFSGLQSNVEFVSTLGETYYIVVGGFGAGQGNYELSVTCAPVPTLPECTGPITAIPNASCSVTTVQFAWDAVVDADGYNIYAGDIASGNYNLTPAPVFNALPEIFLNNPTPNTTFYILVVPTNIAGEAIGCIEISYTTPDVCPPPANNDICDAFDLTSGGAQDLGTFSFLSDMTCFNQTGTTSSASGTFTASCGALNNPVWYTFTTPMCDVGGVVPFQLEFTTANAGNLLDSRIAVFSADGDVCSGALTEVACNGDGFPPVEYCGTSTQFFTSHLFATLEPGKQYWVAVANWSAFDLGTTFVISGRAIPQAHGVTTTGGGTQIALSTANMGAGLYTYYYKQVGSTGHSTSNSQTSLTDIRTLAPGNDYITQVMYRCDASNFFNQNQWYRTEPQTITLENQCALVNDMTCTFNGPNSYTLTWTEPSGELFTNNGALSGYRIKRNPIGSTGVYTFSNPAVVCDNGVCSVTLPGNSPTGFNWTIETRCSANTVQVGNTTSCGPQPNMPTNPNLSSNTDRSVQHTFSFVNAEAEIEFVDVQMFDAYADFGLNTPMLGDYELFVNENNEINWRRVDSAVDFGFDFMIVPNPTNAMTTVYMNTIVEEGSFTVIDAMGRTIFAGYINNTDNVDVDATQLQSGVYMVVVTVGNQQLTRRLVVAN